jgi:excisionase family DNA binding protein
MEAIAVSINDAAKALGLGRTSIYVMINNGRLKAYKVGRRTLVTAESVRAILADADDFPAKR